MLNDQKIILDNLKEIESVDQETHEKYRVEVLFTERLAEYLTVCMSIHTGHPEKYIEIQDRIGELIYDHNLSQPLDVESIKSSQLWVPLSVQQNLTSFEAAET